jgi:hypothetical protein
MNAQSIARRIADSGCYFLSILHLANRENEAIGFFRQALSIGVMQDDCYILDPAKLLALVAGGKWSVSHQGAEYQTANDEYEILRFERKATTKTYAHFVVGDGRGQVAYDPLDTSQTVAQGKLVSKRIFKRLA